MYTRGARIEWEGEPASVIENIALREALTKLKPWERAWLEGYRYATSYKGRCAIDTYLRKRIRQLMEG